MTEAIPNPTSPNDDSPVATRLPPEQRFWQRYSPHHELSLSGTTSLVLHGLAIGVLLLGGLLLTRAGLGSDPASPAVGTLTVGADPSPGDPADGPRGPAPLREAAGPIQQRHEPSPSVERPTPLLVPRSPDLAVPEKVEGERLMEGTDEVIDQLARIRQEADKIRASVNILPPAPVGSPDRVGPKGGPPGGGPSIRNEQTRKRELRWTLVFTTRNGDDYLAQLRGLGAVLAVPQPDGRFLVFRNLGEHPARGRLEDADQLAGIRWYDQRPESIRSLAGALGIELPSAIVAVFPGQFEQSLLRKELAFAGRKEEAIQATQFQVIATAQGVEVRVVGQTPVRGTR